MSAKRDGKTEQTVAPPLIRQRGKALPLLLLGGAVFFVALFFGAWWLA